MTEPRLKSVQCLSSTGLHHMAYREWGDPKNPKVLFCVHGLTRVSNDFDDVARTMCDEYRVICPDVVGRGRSGRLKNSKDYAVPQYVADMVTLAARAEAETLHWFGTSMGGLIGMGFASLPGSPIKKMLLNDIGPTLDGAALKRIGDYVSKPIFYDTFDEALAYIRTVSVTFGEHTDAEWRKFAGDVLMQDANGKWTRNYDIAIADPFKVDFTPEAIAAGQAAMWAAWDAIQCPVLVVRGETSDLLSRETVKMMETRGPKAKSVEVPGVGHAPTFMHADQLAIARNFFLGD